MPRRRPREGSHGHRPSPGVVRPRPPLHRRGVPAGARQPGGGIQRRPPEHRRPLAAAVAEDVKHWKDEGLTFDAETMELRSNSRLLVSFDAAAEPDDPCEPASTGGYLGAENQVIRVQVAAVNEDGTFDLLWGWDNAS